MTVGAQRSPVQLALSAHRALLHEQLALERARPERLGLRVGDRSDSRLRAFRQLGHGAWLPSTRVAPVDSIPPVPCTSAISGVGHLPRRALAAQLAHRFDDEEHPAHAGMTGRQPAAVGVRRQRPVPAQAPALDERAALALAAEPEVLEREQHGDRERVVQLEHVDVGQRHAGALERQRTGLRGRREVDVGHLADVEVMRERVGRAEDVGRRLAQIAGPLVRRDDARRAAVGDHAAVEHVQRVGDEARRQHVVDGDRIAVLRQRVDRRVIAHRDGDLGQLLRRRAVVVLVTSGGQRIVADERVAPHRVGRRRPDGRRTRSAGAEAPSHLRQLHAAVGDEHDLGVAAVDGVGRVLDEHLEGRAAGVGLVEVRRVQPEVLAQLHGVHREEPGGGVAVDLVPRDAGVGQRPVGRDRVDPELGQLRMVRVVGGGNAGDHSHGAGTLP